MNLETKKIVIVRILPGKDSQRFPPFPGCLEAKQMKLQKAGNTKGVENLMLASGNGNGGEEGVFINFYNDIVDSPDLSSGNWVRLGEHSAADIDHWSMFLKSEELALLFSGPETWKVSESKKHHSITNLIRLLPLN